MTLETYPELDDLNRYEFNTCRRNGNYAHDASRALGKRSMSFAQDGGRLVTRGIPGSILPEVKLCKRINITIMMNNEPGLHTNVPIILMIA